MKNQIVEWLCFLVCVYLTMTLYGIGLMEAAFAGKPFFLYVFYVACPLMAFWLIRLIRITGK